MRGDYLARVRRRLPRTIRLIRFRLGLTGAAFAELIGVGQPKVSQYECGIGRPPVAVLLRILALAKEEERPALERALSKLGFSAQGLEAAARNGSAVSSEQRLCAGRAPQERAS
jgi:transcriptional regulator with XRE-family HTH domain